MSCENNMTMNVQFALLKKDPAVTFKDFHITKFNIETLGLTLAYDTRLIIDNTASPLKVTVAPAIIELYYGQEMKIDQTDWDGVVIPAEGRVPTTITHEKKWGLADLPLLATLLADWAKPNKDLEFHIKTTLDVRVSMYRKTQKIDCLAVVKGRSLTEKPVMTCTSE